MGADGVETIEVTYRLSDIAAFTLVTWKQWVAILLVTGAVLTAVNPIMTIASGYSWDEGLRWIDWRMVGIVLGAMGIWLIVATIAKHFWNLQKGLNGPIRMTLAEDGLKVVSRRIDATIFWASMKAVNERSGRLFFLLKSKGAIIAPARCFADRVAFEHWASAARDRFQRSQ